VPFVLRKFSRCGICSRSDGTFGLSREKWTLSKTMLITCLTPLPSWQGAVGAVAAVAAAASPPPAIAMPTAAAVAAAAAKMRTAFLLIDSPLVLSIPVRFSHTSLADATDPVGGEAVTARLRNGDATCRG
jgi:hypothetical protein